MPRHPDQDAIIMAFKKGEPNVQVCERATYSHIHGPNRHQPRSRRNHNEHAVAVGKNDGIVYLCANIASKPRAVPRLPTYPNHGRFTFPFDAKGTESFADIAKAVNAMAERHKGEW